MATQRPSYQRTDTDGTPLQDISMAGTSTAIDDGKAKLDEKDTQGDVYSVEGLPTYDPHADDHFGEAIVITKAKEIITTVLHVDDDPTINPWTFRAWFLGCGLAIFASVLQEIYYFKPQTIYVSLVFLTVIAQVLGNFMHYAIPQKGIIGKFLNPGPFNSKEHALVVIMSSAAATAAVSTEILAAQKLYYNMDPNPAAAIFLVISSQLLGYGIAGLLRGVLVQPTNMLWPINIPVNALLETLHRDKRETKKRLNLFFIIFGAMFFYEIIPEWIFPLLQGVSIFCLAQKHSLVFTNLFGGSSGNEGLGFLSISFDWQYIASLGSPLWIPLQTLTNSATGYLLCIVLFMSIYYGNLWRSQDFPFLSQLLYTNQSNFTAYSEYNLTAILTTGNEINQTALHEQGIPYLTGTYVGYLITTNMGITAALVHMFLWNWDDIKAGFYFLSPKYLRQLTKPSFWIFWKGGITKEERIKAALEDPKIDPHYKLMMSKGYDEVPNWWYTAVLVLSFVVGLGTLYAIKSTLTWWAYILSNIFAAIFILFFGAQYGMTGFQFNQQPVIQMLAGYLTPGRPLANMYFTVFGYNGVIQGQLLLRDLKLAQLAHLSPKATFSAQMVGCVIGAIFNYIMMQSIVNNQADILKSIEGTNVWSGQNVQQYNTLATAWSIAADTFSVGARYQWVTISYLLGFIVPVPFYIIYKFTKIEFFRYMNLSIVLWYMGWLVVGVNSSALSYFSFGFIAQWYIRKYHPALFVKYNYIVSAALDGGTQIMVFILSFAVFGGSGTEHGFPTWAGNNGGNANGLNLDYCMYNSANG